MTGKRQPFQRNEQAGTYTACGELTADDIVGMAKNIVEGRFKRGTQIKGATDTTAYLATQLADAEEEIFACIFLDTRHRVLSFEKLFFGTIDGTSVYPRVVVKRTLAVNASAVILAHNHPSGVAEPSQADVRLTERLKSALDLIDVRVLDHIILGQNEFVSLAERGMV